MRTNDRTITDLMKAVQTGTAQLPDFQRGWVWDDGRIKALIASIIHNFPVGAAMFLTYGNPDIQFKYKPIEGAVIPQNVVPSELILDGQQRLTSIFNALYNDKPVHTKTDKGKEIDRYYYIDIPKALDPMAENDEIIISVPESRIVTREFGREVLIDLSSPEKEYEQKRMPLNLILDSSKWQMWQSKYFAFYQYNPEIAKEFMEFTTKILIPVSQYQMPVILLDKDTPKEAVCQVFENVNTGGVSLTVFELVTAVYAMDGFPLRENWESRKKEALNGDLLTVVTATDFLTALTLLSTYQSGGVVKCKKKDVLNLPLTEYKKHADSLTKGFQEAEKLLQEERIFSSRDLPYSTQLIPLAVLCTLLLEGNRIKVTNVKNKIKQWYWCGVFGELYGSANETRYTYDVPDVMKWIDGGDTIPRTCAEAYFSPTRLLSMQSRLSAAYKGIMALILKNHAQDLISGREMDLTVYQAEKIDIHHIFPQDYCVKCEYDKSKWNSIVNKTPISASTNREIGGNAPSKYLSRIEKKGDVYPETLDVYLRSHWIDSTLCRADDFDHFIIDRAKKLLDAIASAMGKTISGRDSEEVIQRFGASLV
ncbi:MAG: DUF262 domain-containing protein [Clostridia bacterium]|nr:DUF262 domain-containing protein [Clostridia bacterium]